MSLLGVALSGTAGLVVVVLLVMGAAATLAVAIGLFVRGREDVGERLEPYRQEPASQIVTSAVGGQSLAETRVVQQAVGVTERVASRTGLLSRLDSLLEQAEVPLRPAEIAFFYSAGLLLLAILLFFLAPEPIVGLILLAVIAVIPYVVLRRKAEARRLRFEEQLPDTLSLLAGALRAGFSLLQAMETVIQETDDPIRKELVLAFNEARLGGDLESALDDAAERMESRDLAWAVMALRIQREVGGNLAELLDTVAQTMKQREQLRREIRALTAEGRISGIVLGMFPPVMAGVLYVLRPSYMQVLFKSTGGIVAVIVGVVLAVIGFIWLRRIIEIEV